MRQAGSVTSSRSVGWTAPGFCPGAEDVDKTLQLITDNGGAVLRPAEDTPDGRLAAASDPTGAALNLSSPLR